MEPSWDGTNGILSLGQVSSGPAYNEMEEVGYMLTPTANVGTSFVAYGHRSITPSALPNQFGFRYTARCVLGSHHADKRKKQRSLADQAIEP